ncbi:DUF6093 family protein, partial [Streptomyces sp. NPDC005877]|uniref:DUF6093 family protein n=1 Tax=Streptomyces sp. NPDC005877 TaxID=3155346 RepID=UPI0033D25380
PATGELERPVGTVLYEGPGAVQPQAQSRQAVAPDAGQPWVGETISRYRLLTPLDAPIAPKDALVTVTAVHNPFRDALLGRSWVCTDESDAATLEAVRITGLDQNRGPQDGGTP